ncbi:hypothetical protein [uncultured Shewanella sp.]|uniref:hypothetical protein n=1 Tax=uncultured Shewanella sp. TaxID=173975 RepID=UPI003704406E
MNKRSNASKLRHAESMIRIGENIHNSIILTILVAPIIYIAKQLVESEIYGLMGIFDFLHSNDTAIWFLLFLTTISGFIGTKFKHWGYDILDQLNKKPIGVR